MKNPSTMAYAMQQRYIPDALVVDKYDEIFVCNFFRDKTKGTEALLYAVHWTDDYIRRELQCGS